MRSTGRQQFAGDIYSAAKCDPRIILLIDGAFESGVAVLHNEILWALSTGTKVCGAASMGALRAAELACFGMVGFGAIFEAYRDGLLERDDAVAVVHGPAELEYPPLSMPLVDVWATLDEALRLGLLSADESTLLKKAASGVFYKNLDIETLLGTGIGMGLPENRAEDLRRDLIPRCVSQKRRDAIAALRAMTEEVPLQGAPIPFTFEYTSAWESLVAEQEERDIRHDTTTLSSEAELAAIALVLGEKEMRARGFVLGHPEFEQAARRFRRNNNLHAVSEIQRWMQIATFEHGDYVKLIEDEYLLEHSRRLIQHRTRNLASRVDRIRRSVLALKMNRALGRAP